MTHAASRMEYQCNSSMRSCSRVQHLCCLHRECCHACRSLDETWALVSGVQRCGGGRWADIKKLGLPALARRSPVDLKDKWRNLARVAVHPSTVRRCSSDSNMACLYCVSRHIIDAHLQIMIAAGGKGGCDQRPEMCLTFVLLM